MKISLGKRLNERYLTIVFLTLFILGLIIVFFFIFKKPVGETSKSSASSSAKQVATKAAPKPPELTLKNIFATKSASLADLDQSKIVTLIATGDVIPARGANYPAVKSGNFHYNWEKTADFLKAGDITLINLEAPLTKSCPLINSGFTFCGDSRHIQGLTFAGVDVASLANNHIGNFGPSGIAETEKLLTDNGVEFSGFDHLGIKEVKGTKFGFLAYNGIGTTIDREGMASEIKAARPSVDVLIISVHWGKEYESLPMTDGNIAPDNPVELGHIMIDSGADLVIGNHPHWVQGVEIYKGKLITYAHGNFIFDQTWSEETQEGVVGTYSFLVGNDASSAYNKELASVHYTPIKVDIKYQPFFASGDTASNIMKRMIDSSAQLEKNSK